MIERFLQVQREAYNRALEEIESGRNALIGCGISFLR